MNVIRDRDFEDEEVTLDFVRFVDCTFRDCVLKFHGSGPFIFDDCDIGTDCQYEFVDAAERTIIALKGLYQTGYIPLFLNILKAIVGEKFEHYPRDEGEEGTKIIVELGPFRIGSQEESQEEEQNDE